MTNNIARVIIEFPPNSIDSAEFVSFTKMVRKIVHLHTGMNNITSGEYEEGDIYDTGRVF